MYIITDGRRLGKKDAKKGVCRDTVEETGKIKKEEIPMFVLRKIEELMEHKKEKKKWNSRKRR